MLRLFGRAPDNRVKFREGGCMIAAFKSPVLRFFINSTFALVAICWSTTARAQVYSGSITGLVTDPSGAAVPNATVALTDEEKGFSYSARSDNDGRYVLRNLPPGRYRLAV